MEWSSRPVRRLVLLLMLLAATGALLWVPTVVLSYDGFVGPPSPTNPLPPKESWTWIWALPSGTDVRWPQYFVQLALICSIGGLGSLALEIRARRIHARQHP